MAGIPSGCCGFPRRTRRTRGNRVGQSFSRSTDRLGAGWRRRRGANEFADVGNVVVAKAVGRALGFLIFALWAVHVGRLPSPPSRGSARWRGLPGRMAQRAVVGRARQADGMASVMPVVVYPPDEDGGRRVRVDSEILGRAYGLRDIAEFLRRAGIEDVTESGLIE